MSDSEWRPKVGEEVMVRAKVRAGIVGDLIHVETPRTSFVAEADAISPLPAPAAPREPWEVLREAADVLAEHGSHISADSLRRRSDEIEAAARPKPPTLAEAAADALRLLEAPCTDDREKHAVTRALREAINNVKGDA